MKKLDDYLIKWMMGIVSTCIIAFIGWISLTTFNNSIAIAVMQPEVKTVYNLAIRHWNTIGTTTESLSVADDTPLQ